MVMVLCPKPGSFAFTPPGDEMSEVAPSQTIMREQLVQGRYLAAIAGFEPSTFLSTCSDSSNAPPSPILSSYFFINSSLQKRPFITAHFRTSLHIFVHHCTFSYIPAHFHSSLHILCITSR